MLQTNLCVALTLPQSQRTFDLGIESHHADSTPITMALTWSHAFVNVKNLNQMVSFYTDVLGFRVNDQADGIAFLSQLEDEHHQIAFKEDTDQGNESSRVGHFAFRVESLVEVKRLYQELTSNDEVGKVVPVTHGNTWSIYFHDPERNGIEVFCDTPWDADQPFAEPWDPQMNRADLETYTTNLIKEHGDLKANPRAQVDFDRI